MFAKAVGRSCLRSALWAVSLAALWGLFLETARAQAPSRSSSSATKAARADEHPGPLGLKWGKSPADARSILNGKLEFISEFPAESSGYHTIDQKYKGTFGGLAAAEVLLKFYQGEFFYLAVDLATADTKSAARVWDRAVRRMRMAYGTPARLNPPPHLGSNRAIHDHVPLESNREVVLPMLWNDPKGEDRDLTFQTRDLLIRTQLWDPLAAWRFKNQVVIQVFVHQQWDAKSAQYILKPLWIFAKEDRLKQWMQKVHEEHFIPPRDF